MLAELPSPVIDALAPRDRARLLDGAVARTLAPNELLFLAGDTRRRVYVLRHGVIKLAARTGDGRETIIHLAVPGDLVDDVGAFDGDPQPLDAVAAGACDIAGLDADMLVDATTRSPAAALELAALNARRTRWICDAALERTASEVPARLAGRLLDLAMLLGRQMPDAIEMELPLAQGDLARLAGMCRESACKTLRGFQKKGVLDYEGRRMRILRPDILEAIRCAGRG